MIYSNATLSRKQSLIRGVFKHNLTYVDGTFRTASIEPAFRDNALIANKKGLLEIEEAKDIWDEIPSSTQGRDRTGDLPLFRRTLVPTELPGRTATEPNANRTWCCDLRRTGDVKRP